MEADFLHQGDQQFEVVQRAGRLTGIVTPPDVQNETAIFRKYPVEFPRKAEEPFNIVFLILVPVFFLEVERVRWRGEDQIYGSIGDSGHNFP